jgi:hypothetical protein
LFEDGVLTVGTAVFIVGLSFPDGNVKVDLFLGNVVDPKNHILNMFNLLFIN